MPSYTVELYGSFSLLRTITAQSEEEAIQIAASEIGNTNPDLNLELSEVEINENHTYTSLSQHFSAPPQQPQAYVPMRDLTQQSPPAYTPYGG